MVIPCRRHRGPDGPRTPFSLARHVSSMISAALVALVAMALSSCAHTSDPGTAASAASATQAGAARMVELGAEHGEKFLAHSETRAIRNMLGGVRGVFLAPDLTAEAAIFGRRARHRIPAPTTRQGVERSGVRALQRDEPRLSGGREGITHADLAHDRQGSRQLRARQDGARRDRRFRDRNVRAGRLRHGRAQGRSRDDHALDQQGRICRRRVGRGDSRLWSSS